MPAIMDVSFTSFQTFRRNNPLFYWIETKKDFVLLKLGDNAIIRTTVSKTSDEQDMIWRERNLMTAVGGIMIDGAIDLGVNEDVRAIRALLENQKPKEGEK